MVIFVSQVVCLVYLVRCLVVSTGLSILLREGDACALSQKRDGFNKADAVNLLDEFEDVAAGTAAEAVIDLSFGTNAKRGGIFVVKRAKAE